MRRTTGLIGGLAAGCLLAALGLISAAAPASADVTSDVQAAADMAISQGYRTAIGVLDLTTGRYVGAGEDTGDFASESVVKVMIATELLLTGQMTGDTESTAYRMITESDDDDADALYGLVGGDDLINEMADHYGISSLGSPPSSPGWWGNTQINAKALVYFYAAVAKDPKVGPWLTDAMAHTTEIAADGTDQFFGIPAADPQAATKQGWGDDGDDSPNAEFNSTGYVNDGRFAVAILTDGPPASYGSAIGAVITAQAHALMPSGKLDDPATHDPTVVGITASATGDTVRISGTATDPDTTGPVTVVVRESGTQVASTATDPATGAFVASFAAVDGTYSYSVTAVNIGEGAGDTTVPTGAVVVRGDPTGAITSVVGGAGEIVISGTIADPGLAGDATARIAVSIDGGTPTVLDTGVGTYRVAVPAPAGRQQVAVTYLGSGGGTDVTEGSWPVEVADGAAQWHSERLFAIAAAALGLLVLVPVAVTLRRGRRRRAR